MDSLLTFGLQLMKVATLFPSKLQSFYMDINKVIAFDAADESIANSIIRLVWAATVDRMGTFVWIEINNATDKYNLDELKWLCVVFFPEWNLFVSKNGSNVYLVELNCTHLRNSFEFDKHAWIRRRERKDARPRWIILNCCLNTNKKQQQQQFECFSRNFLTKWNKFQVFLLNIKSNIEPVCVPIDLKQQQKTLDPLHEINRKRNTTGSYFQCLFGNHCRRDKDKFQVLHNLIEDSKAKASQADELKTTKSK